VTLSLLDLQVLAAYFGRGEGGQAPPPTGSGRCTGCGAVARHVALVPPAPLKQAGQVLAAAWLSTRTGANASSPRERRMW
jgi:hypothetical protein